MEFKDLFSAHASAYALFRPHYPPELFTWLAEQSSGRGLALDVGAGNGQAANELATFFAHVIALEPSDEQIAHARPAANVSFRQGSAESLSVESHVANLIVSAQAFHWFKHDRFFAEVRRVARPAACLAVWCYGLASVSSAVDALVLDLYEARVGRYWEAERALVETGYRTVDIPFAELAVPGFSMRLRWSFEQLVGYLGTWSALKRYVQVEGCDPLLEMRERLREAWGESPEREMVWPLSVRAFRL